MWDNLSGFSNDALYALKKRFHLDDENKFRLEWICKQLQNVWFSFPPIRMEKKHRKIHLANRAYIGHAQMKKKFNCYELKQCTKKTKFNLKTSKCGFMRAIFQLKSNFPKKTCWFFRSFSITVDGWWTSVNNFEVTLSCAFATIFCFRKNNISKCSCTSDLFDRRIKCPFWANTKGN